jgi:hypothetical protein
LPQFNVFQFVVYFENISKSSIWHWQNK